MAVIDTHTIAEILGDQRVAALDGLLEFHELALEGLRRRSVDALADFMQLSLRDLSELLPISERSLRRYAADHVLERSVSSQILELGYALSRGMEVFEDRGRLLEWLQTPCIPLGNRPPKTLMSERFGIELVLEELGRIEHGIFS